MLSFHYVFTYRPLSIFCFLNIGRWGLLEQLLFQFQLKMILYTDVICVEQFKVKLFNHKFLALLQVDYFITSVYNHLPISFIVFWKVQIISFLCHFYFKSFSIPCFYFLCLQRCKTALGWNHTSNQSDFIPFFCSFFHFYEPFDF